MPTNASNHSGTPFEIDLNTLPPNPGDDFVDFSALLTVTLIEPGDFDLDGDVDGNDYLQWVRGESPNPLSSNDLSDWQTNYSFGTTVIAGLTTVPEPASISLFSLVLAMCLAGDLRQKI